jgi:hypothetical protein
MKTLYFLCSFRQCLKRYSVAKVVFPCKAVAIILVLYFCVGCHSWHCLKEWLSSLADGAPGVG